MGKKKKRFDVFLSHNSKDKPTVRRLGEELKARGLAVWLDEWELVPGRLWEETLEEIVKTAEAAAVLVGKDGMGPWQDHEMRGCLSEFVRRGMPVIPVLLPRAPKKPRLPLFLKQFTWVDLRSGLSAEGLDRLVWGIKGRKQPKLRVVHPDAQPLPARRLLRDLERSIAHGKLQESLIASIVLPALREEIGLELSSRYDPSWLITGIRRSDEYFVPVRQSAGHRDWQRDFAQTVTPTLVGVTRSLDQSADAQALVIRLCHVLAARLRLSLIWPEDPDQSNELKNAIYRACLNATELESDEVLEQLKGLTVVGPK